MSRLPPTPRRLGERLSARRVNEMETRIRDAGIAEGGADVSIGRSGTILSGESDHPGNTWVHLVSPKGAIPSDYQFVWTAGSGAGGWSDSVSGGVAHEANLLAGLAGKRVQVANDAGLYTFAYKRLATAPGCVTTICVTAWSIGDYCAIFTAGMTPDCKVAKPPGAMADVVVAVSRVYLDGKGKEVEESYADGKTDGNGSWCITIPVTLADPTVAPIIDPIGGGINGNVTLAIGTYKGAYNYVTHYGATRSSPQSPEFQVGIPDPGQYPAINRPIVAQRLDTTGGSLDLGVWFAKVVYRDVLGNHNLPSAASLAISAGLRDPTVAPTIDQQTGASALASGDYLIAYDYADAAGETNLSPSAAFTKFPAILPTATFPVIPVAGTTMGAYLSRDGGANWVRYATGVTATTFDLTLALGVAPLHSGTNTTAGNIPRLTFDPLAVRPNATARDLYVSTSVFGVFRLYRAGITATTTDLDIATNPAGALIPSANNSLKNIPRATFTPAGITTRVYALPQPDGTPCIYFEAMVSPRNLSGPVTANGCPPTDNSTGWGTFRVRATSCNQQKADVTVARCNESFTLGFGFCCFTHKLNMTDYDSGGPVGATFVCGNAHACTDVGGNKGSPIPTTGDGTGTVVGWCWGGLACPVQVSPTGVDCKQVTAADDFVHGFGTRCEANADNYWNRCFFVASPCAAPVPIITAKGAKMYSKANWVRNVNCGNCTPADDRLIEMVPRVLHLSFTGPEALTGSAGAAAFTLNFDDAASNLATGHLEWTTGCLGGQGGWGYCRMPFTGICFVGDCTKFPLDSFVPEGIDHKVFYQSTKVRVIQYAPGEADCHGLGGVQASSTAVVYQNYWNGGCPAFDPAPSCGFNDALGRPVTATPRWICDSPICNCGSDPNPIPSGLGLVGSSYNSYAGVIDGINCIGLVSQPAFRCTCRLCGPINYSGSSSSSAPDCIVTCSGVLTE